MITNRTPATRSCNFVITRLISDQIALHSVQYNNRVDVRGHKYVFGPTQTHFSPSAARVKMSLRRAKNIFMSSIGKGGSGAGGAGGAYSHDVISAVLDHVVSLKWSIYGNAFPVCGQYPSNQGAEIGR